MLAAQQRLLSGSRVASRQPRPFAAARSRVLPTIVAKVKLAPLVDAFKADQLRTDLPKVNFHQTQSRNNQQQPEAAADLWAQSQQGPTASFAGISTNILCQLRAVFSTFPMICCFTWPCKQQPDVSPTLQQQAVLPQLQSVYRASPSLACSINRTCVCVTAGNRQYFCCKQWRLCKYLCNVWSCTLLPQQAAHHSISYKNL